ncbi:MAG: hypothetical protein ACQEW8_10685 [Actinomycetota bacterium]
MRRFHRIVLDVEVEAIDPTTAAAYLGGIGTNDDGVLVGVTYESDEAKIQQAFTQAAFKALAALSPDQTGFEVRSMGSFAREAVGDDYPAVELGATPARHDDGTYAPGII